MDEEKPYNPAAQQPQPDDDEAPVHNAAAASASASASADVVGDATLELDDAPWQEEAAPVEGNDGADWLYFVNNAAGTENNEEIAQALYMEELREMEAMEMRRFEEPRVADEAPVPNAAADVVGDATLEDDAPRQEEAAPVEHYNYGADWQYFINHAAGTDNDEEIAQALYMEELRQMEDREMRDFEEPRLADVFAGVDVPAAAHNQFEATPPHVSEQANNDAYRPYPDIIGRRETVTIRLEPRNKDAVISARHEVLAGASSSVLVGMEEEGSQDDGWYDSIVHEAQRIEEIDEPELYDGVSPFERQFQRRSESPVREEEPCYYSYSPTNDMQQATGEGDDLCREFSLKNFTKRWGLDPSELDPDEPGPSTKRQMRVAPLADHDVPSFHCGICIETLPVLDLFHGTQCDHKFCVECMTTYIEGRVHAGEVPIPCPDPECSKPTNDDDADPGGLLHPEQCKKSIDFAAFGSWGDRLTERAIPPRRRAYCPNRQCGVMLESTGGKTPALVFCPVCCHAMCATCGFDWGDDDDGAKHDCTEGPAAELVRKLAAERRWKQCPKCKMLVERSIGCKVMRCRCLFIFCYDCGRPFARGEEAGGEKCQCDGDTGVLQAHGLV